MSASGAITSTDSKTRRDFLKLSGHLAGASVLAGLAPRLYAGENNTIKLALVGCGGRGTGAVADAFAARGGPVKLYAMADLFEQRSATRISRPSPPLRSMFRRSGNLSVSMPTRRRLTVSTPATSCC